MTRYYLDTEFLDTGYKLRLISIALVCEDGRELYFALSDWLKDDGTHNTADDRADDWLRENVFKQLPTCTCPADPVWPRYDRGFRHNDECLWRSREQIADAIKAFITVEPKEQIEVWAYFASYDWVLFCMLFGKMINLPAHFPWLVNDLKTWARHIGYTGKFRDLLPDSGHHIALEDARWNRDVHKILLERQRLLQSQEPLAFLADALVDALDGSHEATPTETVLHLGSELIRDYESLRGRMDDAEQMAKDFAAPMLEQLSPANNPSVAYAVGGLLRYAQHKYDCDWLQPMWHKGPCDCGFKELIERLPEDVLKMLVDINEHARATVEGIKHDKEYAAQKAQEKSS